MIEDHHYCCYHYHSGSGSSSSRGKGGEWRGRGEGGERRDDKRGKDGQVDNI